MFLTSALTRLLLTKQHISFFESLHHPYYIVCPDYMQKSSGPRVLHYLCHTLNELGYEAYITANVTSPWLRTPKLTKETREKHEATGRTPIMVYPEVLRGNPLGGKVIARWILNKAGHLGGEFSFQQDEMLFYWDEWVLSGEKNADRLYLDSVNTRIFNTLGADPEHRSGTCYYAHKYLMYGGKVHPWLLENSTSLCQDILRSPEEIAHILKTSSLLYCYEPSNLISEAYTCGCPAIIIRTAYSEQFDLSRTGITQIEESAVQNATPPTIGVKFKERYQANIEKAWPTVENFIEKTQAAAQAYSELAKTPRQQLKEAIGLFSNDHLVKATEILAPLLDALPDDPLPAAYLAFVCAAQGLPQEADEFLTRALEIAPGRADFKAGLGERFLKSGQPERAADYLREAITTQPDLFAAYPALAQSLHLTQRSDAAIALLNSAVAIPSAAQSNILATLLEILVQQGNISEFAQICRRHSNGIADDLLAVRYLSHFDASGELLVEALGKAQERLVQILSGEICEPTLSISSAPPWKIAFMLSDFAREQQQGRLSALLNHLPADQFLTTLIINDPHAADSDFAQVCSLVADHTLVIREMDDAAALLKINPESPDILVDLDSYGPADRLSLFAQAKAGIKLLWGEAPMPALVPGSYPLQGEKVADLEMLPGVILPGLGECCALPEIPIVPTPATPTLGCLTPAIRIGPEGWQLFAKILHATPESQLLLNLKELGDCARDYISRQFENAGIAATRLRFVHAHTVEQLCQHWQEVTLGLAAPVDAGDQALTTCLWMGRPFVALAGNLPWSHRPTALLDCVGASVWIADTPARYVELAQQFPSLPDKGLRERLQSAGLNDSVAFAQGFASTMAALMQANQAQCPSL